MAPILGYSELDAGTDDEDTLADEGSEGFWDDDEPEEPVTDGPLKGKTVTVKRWPKVACYVVADDGETWATVVMVGDDKKHRVNRDDCTEVARKAYCGVCGQIGCAHDGMDRDDEDDDA